MAVPKEASCRLDGNFHCGSTGWPALLLPPVSWALVRTSLQSVTQKKNIKNRGKLRGRCAACQWMEELSMSPSWSVFQKGDMGMYPSSHSHIPGVSSENGQKKKKEMDQRLRSKWGFRSIFLHRPGTGCPETFSVMVQTPPRSTSLYPGGVWVDLSYGPLRKKGTSSRHELEHMA